MRLTRRQLVIATAAIPLQISLAARAADSPAWPSRPVRFIVPFPAGSAADVLMRLLGVKLAERWGQAVVVDNKPGGSGVIGMSALMTSPADAYTFGFAQGSAISVAPSTIRGVPYSYTRDFAPVSLVAVAPLLLAVPYDSPFRKAEDLVTAAKARPESVEVGDPGRATLPHLAAALLGAQSGTQFLHVHFQGGGQALQAMLGGQTKAQVETYNVLAGMVDARKLRVLASFGDGTEPGLESVPVLRAAFPGVIGNGWFAVIARKGTPGTVVERINRDLAALLQQDEIVAKFKELGAYPRPGTPAQLDAYIAADQRQWQAVLDRLNIKPE
jgi:tripartite-type tricarboxylate transporter receptor subunit TctC